MLRHFSPQHSTSRHRTARCTCTLHRIPWLPLSQSSEDSDPASKPEMPMHGRRSVSLTLQHCCLQASRPVATDGPLATIHQD